MSEEYWVETVANAAWAQEQERELQPVERAILWAADELQRNGQKIATLQAENERLLADRRWIPVSEQMPPVGEYVTVCFRGAVQHQSYRLDLDHSAEAAWWENEWLEPEAWKTLSSSDKWMPLPEPPTEGEI